LGYADGTWGGGPWESKSLPEFNFKPLSRFLILIKECIWGAETKLLKPNWYGADFITSLHNQPKKGRNCKCLSRIGVHTYSPEVCYVRKTMVKSDDLIIPVYLNQRVVFDLVAMLQGGIASVTQVSQTQQESGTAGVGVRSEFGLSNALSSLLRIDFSGKASSTTTRMSGETWSEQRIHTPASLFIALRALLREKRYIVYDSDGAKLSPGSIVEFSASLRRNPLLETIGTFVEFLDVVNAFADNPSKGKGSRLSEEQKMKRQMELFISALATSDTTDLTTAPLKSAYRSVITLEKQYLNDPSMSDLVDGTFRVVGKVTRVIDKGKGAISLNRKSAMGRLPNSMLVQLKGLLDGPELKDFSLPKMEWEIPGPVIQVLPIAIFA